MKVTLISHTPDALNLLLRTKNTRLSNADDDPANWSADRRQEHLGYMRDTIKSSWEFVDYTFEIEGVTRAFTHQLVRTRTGSYAQQAMRVVDARNQPVETPPSIAADHLLLARWNTGVQAALRCYSGLVDENAPLQDARGILPTHITTSIMAKFNLRTLHEMAKLRLCTRTQGEYQNVFRSMRELVQNAHPWAGEFLEVHCVAHGTCAFPRYGKESCPVWFPELDNAAVKNIARERFWAVRHEAAPVAVGGKAM